MPTYLYDKITVKPLYWVRNHVYIIHMYIKYRDYRPKSSAGLISVLKLSVQWSIVGILRAYINSATSIYKESLLVQSITCT